MSDQVVLPKIEESLINVLLIVGGGTVLTEAAKQLQDCVKSAMLDGASTSLTIKLEFKKSTDESLKIRGYSKCSIPVIKPSSAFFVSQDYLPSRERPNQQLMNFK